MGEEIEKDRGNEWKKWSEVWFWSVIIRGNKGKVYGRDPRPGFILSLRHGYLSLYSIPSSFPSCLTLSFSLFLLFYPPTICFFISDSIFSASFHSFFPCSCFCPSFLPLKLPIKQFQNWEDVYINHIVKSLCVCACVSHSLSHSLCLTLCLCPLKLNFAVFLAAFESLVEGRQCLPQAFSQPFLSLQHTHSRANTHVPWQLCCFGGVGWLISLYGDDTSCNEQEKAGMLICVVWEARLCLCVCMCMCFILHCACVAIGLSVAVSTCLWMEFFFLLIFFFSHCIPSACKCDTACASFLVFMVIPAGVCPCW